jgi:predicted nucleic acid-binding Zn ribbon protein
MSRQRKNSNGFVHVGSVLQDLLKTPNMASNTRLSRIWEVWPDAVGGQIAANAKPAAIKGSLLIVLAESSAWIQQLHYLKREMIAKLNRTLGENLVKDIKFKIGTLQ